MDFKLESWVILQGWERHKAQNGQTYYCRKKPLPRVGLFDDGRVVIGWHDRGYVKTVEELVKLMMDYAEGEEISV